MLQAVEIGNNVTKIGSYTFSYCYSLTSVVISDGVRIIDNYTFYFCYSLANVVIPKNVKKIGTRALSECYGMAVCDFSQCTSVPTISSNTFSDISLYCKIVVPDALYDEWIAATNWSSYASNIVKASEFNA